MSSWEKKKRAIATLRDASDAKVTNFLWMVNDPDLYSLHDDSGFLELAKDR